MPFDATIDDPVEEFFQNLANLKDMRWSYDEAYHIRGTFPNRLMKFCPLTAVCYARTGRYFSIGDYDHAARLLGIPLDKSSEIADAADGYPSADPSIGTRLAKATGLLP